ncbi:MAG TPA: ABC transporter permease [Blastocatellia bacterium]
MKTFVAKRLLSAIPLILAVTFLTQALLILSPYDYLTTLREGKGVSDQSLEILAQQFHLNSHNVFTRYWYWLWQALHGNLGYSFRYSEPVWSLIWERMFNTVLLTGSALVVSWGIAIPLGTLAAVKRDTWIDRVIGFFSFFGLSLPVVFFSLLMLLLAAKTGWFPLGQVHNEIDWDSFTVIEKIGDVLWHLFLPAMVLGTISMGQYMRQMRGEMIETLGKDYIRTARAKGLSQFRIITRHALGNAINPLISLFGLSLAFLLAGAILTETVFSWPGLGRLTFEALQNKDEPLVMATVVLLTIMLVAGSLISDLLLAFMDPRIRLET